VVAHEVLLKRPGSATFEVENGNKLGHDNMEISLTPGQYEFQVRSVTANGSCSTSAPTPFTVGEDIPDAPRELSAYRTKVNTSPDDKLPKLPGEVDQEMDGDRSANGPSRNMPGTAFAPGDIPLDDDKSSMSFEDMLNDLGDLDDE